MSPSKFYKYATLALIIINVFILSFFLWSENKERPRQHRHGVSMKERAVHILKLNDQQLLRFNDIAHEHEEHIRLINEKQHKLLAPYFKSLIDSSIAYNEERILAQFQSLDQEKLSSTRKHLVDIKNLLNEDQLPQFEEFTNQIIARIIETKKKRRPKPKD